MDWAKLDEWSHMVKWLAGALGIGVAREVVSNTLKNVDYYPRLADKAKGAQTMNWEEGGETEDMPDSSHYAGEPLEVLSEADKTILWGKCRGDNKRWNYFE